MGRRHYVLYKRMLYAMPRLECLKVQYVRSKIWDLVGPKGAADVDVCHSSSRSFTNGFAAS